MKSIVACMQVRSLRRLSDQLCTVAAALQMATKISPEISHKNCRNAKYLDGPHRTEVPNDRVDWKASWPEYAPVDYTSEKVVHAPWADDEAKLSTFKFNAMDGLINRKSFTGRYAFDAHGKPLNPHGRTGVRGRGLLGRFGPNHAADPIVTRFRKDAHGKRVLECVLIKRRDTGEWALPGGMVEAGDTVSLTLKKEFGEEAMNSIEATADKRREIMVSLDKLFSHGTVIFEGYVDDPRNTDNAWMETVAMNFHDDDGSIFGVIQLHAGDDAGAVMWVPLDPAMKLYASHSDFIRHVIDMHHNPGAAPVRRRDAAPDRLVHLSWV